VLNASVDWNALKNVWDVRLWGRNLTAAQYRAYETATTPNDGVLPRHREPMGLRLARTFDSASGGKRAHMDLAERATR
jgi:hypothetical protein